MSAALKLIQRIESSGGQIRVEDGCLVIAPATAAEPVIEELRQHKTELIALLQSRTEQEEDSAPGSDALGLWMLARCVYRDRCFGGVGALYLDLARWCAEQGRPMPASRRAFAVELQTEGFVLTADGLVYGLMLREDLTAVLQGGAMNGKAKGTLRMRSLRLVGISDRGGKCARAQRFSARLGASEAGAEGTR